MKIHRVLSAPFAAVLMLFFVPARANSPAPELAVSREDSSHRPEAPKLEDSEEVVCRKPAWGIDCMIQCGKEGLACAPELAHPYKPEAGNGKLWKCAGKTNEEQCKYIYENGDECTYVRKTDKTYCKYTSDK